MIVDPPNKRTLFEGCQWKNFMSASQGIGMGDVETREKNYKYMKLSTCKLDRYKR